MKCQECQEEVEEVTAVKIGRRKMKLCEECLEIFQEQQEISAEAEGAMQGMMEYKGR